MHKEDTPRIRLVITDVLFFVPLQETHLKNRARPSLVGNSVSHFSSCELWTIGHLWVLNPPLSSGPHEFWSCNHLLNGCMVLNAVKYLLGSELLHVRQGNDGYIYLQYLMQLDVLWWEKFHALHCFTSRHFYNLIINSNLLVQIVWKTFLKKYHLVPVLPSRLKSWKLHQVCLRWTLLIYACWLSERYQIIEVFVMIPVVAYISRRWCTACAKEVETALSSISFCYLEARNGVAASASLSCFITKY